MNKEPGFIGLIKDIPAILKGFPKNLFNKPTCLEEYEQCQRASTAYILLSLIPLILFCVLSALGVDEGVNMTVAMIGIVALIYLAYRKNTLKNFYEGRLKALACPNCKAPIGYDENVQYNVLDITWHTSSGQTPMKATERETSNQIVWAEGLQFAKVELTCKCQKCGQEKIFNYDFCIGHCRKEQRNVHPHNADLIKAQFSTEVATVSKAVFEDGQSGSNDKGVTVRCFDLDASIKKFFED